MRASLSLASAIAALPCAVAVVALAEWRAPVAEAALRSSPVQEANGRAVTCLGLGQCGGASSTTCCGVTLSPGQSCFYCDDFTQDNALRPEWEAQVYRSGGASECFSASAVTVSPGTGLILTAADAGVATCIDPHDGGVAEAGVTSGGISWKPGTNGQYGTIHWIVQMPPPQHGQWPTLWQMGTGCQSGPWVPSWAVGPYYMPGLILPSGAWGGNTLCGWPNVANNGGITQPGSEEIDIVEWHDGPKLYSNIFTSCGSSAPNTDIDAAVFATGFHDVSLKWTATSLDYYVDGWPEQHYGPTCIVQNPMFLINTLDMGGAGGVITGLPIQEIVQKVYWTQNP